MELKKEDWEKLRDAAKEHIELMEKQVAIEKEMFKLSLKKLKRIENAR